MHWKQWLKNVAHTWTFLRELFWRLEMCVIRSVSFQIPYKVFSPSKWWVKSKVRKLQYLIKCILCPYIFPEVLWKVLSSLLLLVVPYFPEWWRYFFICSFAAIMTYQGFMTILRYKKVSSGYYELYHIKYYFELVVAELYCLINECFKKHYTVQIHHLSFNRTMLVIISL